MKRKKNVFSSRAELEEVTYKAIIDCNGSAINNEYKKYLEVIPC